MSPHRQIAPTPAETESLYTELKRYVGFWPLVDGPLLREAHPIVAPHFERIAQEFYDRTRAHEEAHAVFADEDQISRLQRSLVRWMERVFTGPHDEAYFEQTLKIGRVHAHLELPQRYMLTAMSLVRNELERIVFGAAASDAARLVPSIHRALDLELAGMLESYRHDYMARLELRHHETNQALQRTEHRYVNAVELANVLVVGVDMDGRILLFNREAERVSGWGREEVLGSAFHEVLANDEGQMKSIVGGIVSGRTSTGVVVESTLKTRGGKVRELRWQLAHAPSKDDEVALFAIGTDVTEERQREDQARQQEKLAAVGTLAAGLAHEIRNPLNGAQLHISFLARSLKKSGNSDPDMQEAVQVVGDEIKRLAVLVSEFLDFARPKPLTRRTIGARALSERVVNLVSQKAEGAGANLVADLPPREVEFEGDGGKLEQVLLNLLHNAIEAVQASGGGTVTLRVRQKPRDVLFEVEDDGPGLPNSDAPIFDAFFSTKPQGTGLGLSISHRIVTDHGGEISVDCRPGRTIFRFTIPLLTR